MSPVSSPITAAIMSVWASGKYEAFCTLSPRPTPAIPPGADSDRRLLAWNPAPLVSPSGAGTR